MPLLCACVCVRSVQRSSAGDVGDAADEEVTLERAFHDWLGFVFLPSAATAIKKKKLANAADKFKAAGAAKAGAK